MEFGAILVPGQKKTALLCGFLPYSREYGIRTHDLFVPNEARYQTALIPGRLSALLIVAQPQNNSSKFVDLKFQQRRGFRPSSLRHDVFDLSFFR